MDALIVDWVRTPRGEGRPFCGGTLAEFHPQDLLGVALSALTDRGTVDPADIEDVICGVANQTGVHADNVARLAILAMGWPVEVSGTTVNRYCGSGQQALNLSAAMVASGQLDTAAAAGVEMWSRYTDMSATLDGGNPRLRERHPTVPQGVAADLIATLEGFSRDELDAFSAASHHRAATAQSEGRFDASIVPVTREDGSVVLERDEHVRPDTTVEGLASLRPSFVAMGSSSPEDGGKSYDEMCLEVYPHLTEVRHVHHAGSSSGMTDGAAVALLASQQFVRDRGLKARARVRSTATCSNEPVVMLTGTVPASIRCLQRAGMNAGDIDLVEINEAFAAVPLKTMRDLGFDHDQVNVNGGAIALGHPVGATGIVLIGTLLDEMERRDVSTGLVTVCTGAGMATATVIERI